MADPSITTDRATQISRRVASLRDPRLTLAGRHWVRRTRAAASAHVAATATPRQPREGGPDARRDALDAAQPPVPSGDGQRAQGQEPKALLPVSAAARVAPPRAPAKRRTKDRARRARVG